MNVTGIIMECNPFHEGHAYLLREARRRASADYLVVAMSGDYVQRGEPAVSDKYLRAEQILRAGADLVLELPLYAACGSAEYFALGGVSLLDRLGVVTDLCFGSESGDTAMLQKSAQLLSLLEKGEPSPPGDPSSPAGGFLQKSAGSGAPAARACAELPADLQNAPAVYREQLQAGLRAGLSWPAARENALSAAAGHLYPATPNDLLAAEYCRALFRAGSAVVPHAIPRIDVPSATARRTRLLQHRMEEKKESGPRQIPNFPLGPDDFSSQLLYSLKMEEDRLDDYADVSPDLGDRIRNLLGQYRSWTGFCDLLKTRNVTRTRVNRALLHLLLRIRKDRLESLREQGMALYARPLAINTQTAAPLLGAIHANASMPFLSKLSAASSLLPADSFVCLQEEFRAEELYTLTLAGAWSSAFGAGCPPVPRAPQRRLVKL